MPKIINVTDLTEYLYCPRKVYLRLVKGIREPPNRPMIFGMMRHKVFDIFGKNESTLVAGINSNLPKQEIEGLYEKLLSDIIQETFSVDNNMASSFEISFQEFSDSVRETMKPEIKIRVEAIKKTLGLGFLGKDLWRNLQPKYLTEYKLESPELGLRGRVDRIKFENGIMPFEVKTRKKVYDSDKIQLAAYALLLEKEFGKPVNKGIMELMGQQEEILLDQELKSKVLLLAEEVRNITQGVMPSNFQKCQECRLKEYCS